MQEELQAQQLQLLLFYSACKAAVTLQNILYYNTFISSFNALYTKS